MAFYCCGRLGNKQMLSTLSRFPTLLSKATYASAAAPKITFKSFEAPKQEHHDERNARLSRPMSPHLTIYQPQLTSMLSITHRIAGMMLSGYFTVLGAGALVLPHDVSHYITMIEGLNLSPASIFLAKAIIAAPFSYHLVNGIRHLYWDTGKGLTIKEVYATGYAMLAGSLAVTIALAAL
ncbi:hypothetical protein JYU34_017244 [Plutella xylostella]|uniref:Succinate dehydrogenase cytochrome b560 subunit, mitochondrial n=1 Tax=Plutella xylostella TaxID=51655 RepID=A0ABQ7Q0Y4_PLUXY|nr:hypothetical protein JYU34_017244 [Plutella xylostella]